MKKNKNMRPLEPVKLMLQWNHYCDAHDMEGDCILLNEDRTYVEAFDNEQQAMKEILNSNSPEFKRDDDGFLVPVYKDRYYAGMRYVPFDKIGEYIDLRLLDL